MVVIQISSKDNKSPNSFTFTNHGKSDVKIELIDEDDLEPVADNVLKPNETKVFQPSDPIESNSKSKDKRSSNGSVSINEKHIFDKFRSTQDEVTCQPMYASTNDLEADYCTRLIPNYEDNVNYAISNLQTLFEFDSMNANNNQYVSESPVGNEHKLNMPRFFGSFSEGKYNRSETDLIRDFLISANTFTSRTTFFPQESKRSMACKGSKFVKIEEVSERITSSSSTSSSSDLTPSEEKRNYKFDNSVSIVPTMTEIDCFHLPPRCFIIALIQDPYDENSTTKGNYTVTNNGLCNIEAEVIFNKKLRSKRTLLRNIIKSKKTSTLDVKHHFHVSSLKIINRSFREVAIFSAKGGLICHSLVNYISPLPSENVRRLKEITKFQILPMTSVIPMIQPSGFKTFAVPTNYSVTNNGRSDIMVEVLNEDNGGEELFFNDIIQPNETRVIELRNNFANTSLKISNYNTKQIAIFSAKGGYVVNDFWHKVQKLPEIGRKKTKLSSRIQSDSKVRTS